MGPKKSMRLGSLVCAALGAIIVAIPTVTIIADPPGRKIEAWLLLGFMLMFGLLFLSIGIGMLVVPVVGRLRRERILRAGITVADLMQTLGMRIFKTRINEPGLPTLKRVALCVKSPESQPITVGSIEIEDAATPGTLLVFLQAGRWEGYRYIGGIVYKGDNGRTSETSGPIRENPFEKVVGTRSGVGITNRPGLAIIECSGTFGGNDELETTPDAAGIYVKVE